MRKPYKEGQTKMADEKNKRTGFSFAKLFGMFIFIIVGVFLSIGIHEYINLTPEQLERMDREYEARKLEEAKQEAQEEKKRAKKAFETRCDKSGMPFVMVQDAVRSRLKSPKSAEFPVRESKTVQYKSEDKRDTNCYYTVLGVVHAQNSFGVMLKNTFMARITYFYKTKRWQVTFVEVQS